MKKLILTSIILIGSMAFASSEVKQDLAFGDNGSHLRKVQQCSADGGCLVSFEVLDQSNQPKNFVMSNTRYNKDMQDKHAEQIAVPTCRTQLILLKDELARNNFKKVIVKPEICNGARKNAVLVMK